MDLEEVIKKRQSVRRFQEKEIPEEKIKKILELANLSPSAGNLQARCVLVIKKKEVKEKIAQAGFGQGFITQAPVVFVICANPQESAIKYGERGEKLYSIQDVTIFAAYLQLAACSLRLSSCWVGAFDEKRLSEILNLPSEIKPIAILPVGYPAEEPYPTGRKDLDEIIFKEI